ncbi:hypothetical protein AL073_06685 [Loktanella sp. 1ANDIMAR09]|uniref:Uncharacterized protein n=1 Tax=Yoonia rosea TaxID=287098 RepID=A0A1R3X3Y6_9RHOB|nr:hypothetical protein [Yoonia rosea]KQB96789.1 hypothetical protein AL073_06685 [Loktanella sp. 1ANDIMAR09]SIT85709.1 hypothetical protein SAMN05421665_2125 [Yoonia rosea]
MAKLTKTSVFKAQAPKAETQMDKTTRIVRKMADDDAEQRQVKINRLRNARLEREQNTPPKTSR